MFFLQKGINAVKTIQELIKDLTGCTVEKKKINDYLEHKALDLRGTDLRGTNLIDDNLKKLKLQKKTIRTINCYWGG